MSSYFPVIENFDDFFDHFENLEKGGQKNLCKGGRLVNIPISIGDTITKMNDREIVTGSNDKGPVSKEEENFTSTKNEIWLNDFARELEQQMLNEKPFLNTKENKGIQVGSKRKFFTKEKILRKKISQEKIEQHIGILYSIIPNCPEYANKVLHVDNIVCGNDITHMNNQQVDYIKKRYKEFTQFLESKQKEACGMDDQHDQSSVKKVIDILQNKKILFEKSVRILSNDS